MGTEASVEMPNKIIYDLVLLDLYHCIRARAKEKQQVSCYRIASEIADLEMRLEDYKDAEEAQEAKEVQEKRWEILKEKGELFHNAGGLPLMEKVYDLMRCYDTYYGIILNSAWSGIGDWLA